MNALTLTRALGALLLIIVVLAVLHAAGGPGALLGPLLELLRALGTTAGPVLPGPLQFPL